MKCKDVFYICICKLFVYINASQQAQHICIKFVQRRPNVFDVGPTLYKCYTNVFVFAGCVIFHVSTRKVKSGGNTHITMHWLI